MIEEAQEDLALKRYDCETRQVFHKVGVSREIKSKHSGPSQLDTDTRALIFYVIEELRALDLKKIAELAQKLGFFRGRSDGCTYRTCFLEEGDFSGKRESLKKRKNKNTRNPQGLTS